MRRLVLGLLVISACAAGRNWRASGDLHRDDTVLVQTERNPDARYAHPATVDGASLAEQLCGLAYINQMNPTYKQKGGVPWSCEDAQKVAEAVTQGLAAASPNERVRFWVHWRERDNGSTWYVPDERHTRGIAYVNDAGQLQMDFDIVDRVQGEGARPTRSPDEGKHRRVRFVPPEGVTLALADGKAQPMRLIWPIADGGGHDRVKSDVDPEQKARLELLEQMYRAGDIDQATYDRKKAELEAGDAQ